MSTRAVMVQLVMNALPNPDDVGSTEYRAVHEHLLNVAESAEDDEDPEDVYELMLGSLEELIGWAGNAASSLRAAHTDSDATGARAFAPDQ